MPTAGGSDQNPMPPGGAAAGAGFAEGGGTSTGRTSSGGTSSASFGGGGGSGGECGYASEACCFSYCYDRSVCLRGVCQNSCGRSGQQCCPVWEPALGRAASAAASALTELARFAAFLASLVAPRIRDQPATDRPSVTTARASRSRRAEAQAESEAAAQAAAVEIRPGTLRALDSAPSRARHHAAHWPQRPIPSRISASVITPGRTAIEVRP